MHILKATIVKDLKILLRDRLGLIMIFFMPVILVIVITSVQNSTFDLVNNNKINLVILNRDSGSRGKEFLEDIGKMGMFNLRALDSLDQENQISVIMHAHDALVGLVIPENFSRNINEKAESIANSALKDPDSLAEPKSKAMNSGDSLRMYYHPVMQASFRRSVDGAVKSILQVIQGQAIVKKLYESLNQREIPQDLEQQILYGQVPVAEIPVSRGGTHAVPNSSQHNVPAWTIFAMFFIVVTLGSGIVRENNSGSFLRLKTLPSSYLYAVLSKQIVFGAVTFLQAALIFGIGRYLFGYIGLPVLHLPGDLAGLFLVTLVTGYCAVSYAICVGVYAETPEQSNGFGAISILIFAAFGGLLVPSFAMPASLQTILGISPLYWSLEGFYGLFLEGGKLRDIWPNILSLLGITAVIQAVTYYGLKKKNII